MYLYMKSSYIITLITMRFNFTTLNAFQGIETTLKSANRLTSLKSTKYVYNPVTDQADNHISTQKVDKSITELNDSRVLVQGGSLRTWSYKSPLVEQIQVVLSTEGRPLNADIELWNGPDNTPCKMCIYLENGLTHPFLAVIHTPRSPNTVAIRNIGQLEFPFSANVCTDNINKPSTDCINSSYIIQGGALRTYPFDTLVDSIQVSLRTIGCPLNARIELLQGPNNNKQVLELYTEDGSDRPFFCIIQTPEAGNVVRIVNTAPVEFPLSASVIPNSIKDEFFSGAVVGGDTTLEDP